ncbi:hypothetical protein QOZ80_6BG0492010 [Eleusine coracana subsp. coracana]|nr:hypothetical protein QOZ80_6BG0492010 [Eleusine coracana subsp. coracana]
MRDRLGIVATKIQIKNKWDKLKEDLMAWKKLLLRQTGTGWSPINGTIVMDEEWWKKASAMSDSESDASSDDDDAFFHIVTSAAKLANIYSDSYLDKAEPRTSIQSEMGWLNETLNPPGECHKILRMNKEIFLDLHDTLVERYGLQPSKHMNTYEILAIFLFICARCESNRMGQNRFKHFGETINRKFHEVLESSIQMAKHYLRPTDHNFHSIHKRIRYDRRAYPHFKNCIGAIDGTYIHVCLSSEEQIRYIGKTVCNSKCACCSGF